MATRFTGEIDRFIYEICYTDIFNAVNERISTHPQLLDLTYSRLKYPDTAILEDMLLQFTNNICIEQDSLFFDAVLSCTVELSEQDDYRGEKNCEINSWLKVSCEAVITDKLNRLTVHNAVHQSVTQNFAERITDIHPFLTVSEGTPPCKPRDINGLRGIKAFRGM